MQPFLRAVCPILIVPEIGREFVDPVIGATWDPLKWYRMIPAAVCFFGKMFGITRVSIVSAFVHRLNLRKRESNGWDILRQIAGAWRVR